jgi:hypothetical protein
VSPSAKRNAKQLKRTRPLSTHYIYYASADIMYSQLLFAAFYERIVSGNARLIVANKNSAPFAELGEKPSSILIMQVQNVSVFPVLFLTLMRE